MEPYKSLAVLAALEKLYCLEQHIAESPKNRHPFLSTEAGNKKQKDGVNNYKNYLNEKYKQAETLTNCIQKQTGLNIENRKRIPFFRLILKKMEKEFPTIPEVQEWREV